MDLGDLNTKVNEFIDNYTILEKKINKILSTLDNLELKLKYCACDIYAPYTKDGECRFCYGYN